MTLDPNSPAQPCASNVNNRGLTVRQHFAAMAMQGILADTNTKLTDDELYENLAVCSVKCADALIAALNKPAES